MKRTAAIVCLVFGTVAVVRGQRTNQPPPLPPPPFPRYFKVNDSVMLRQLSPVAYFRVLLGMTPAQRERALAQRASADRETILRKIAEYEALPAEVREARLHQTELRWTLVCLMKTAPADRAARLQSLLPGDRIIVEERLRQWDTLPAAEQKAYLEKEDFIAFYLRWQNANDPAQAAMLNRLSVSNRTRLSAELARWKDMSPEARQQVIQQFGELFGTNGSPRPDALGALSDRERRQIEASLHAYARMDPEQRKKCVESFSKFAAMSADDRAEFLQNAARWEEMTPEERRVWRELVYRLPIEPPLPSRYRRPRPGDLPPAPPGFPAITTVASKAETPLR